MENHEYPRALEKLLVQESFRFRFSRLGDDHDSLYGERRALRLGGA